MESSCEVRELWLRSDGIQPVFEGKSCSSGPSDRINFSNDRMFFQKEGIKI